MPLECRSFDFEVRAAKDRMIEGYAAVFNQRTNRLGWFDEQVAPGAFSNSIRSTEHDIMALWNHNSDIPLGSRDAGALTLFEDSTGLGFSLRTDQTQWGEFAHAKIADKTIRKMSFGFATITDEWNTENRKELRTLLEVDLFEISPVSFAAYSGTSVEARSVEDAWQKHLACAGAARKAEQRAVPLDVLIRLNEHRRHSLKGGV